MPLSNGYGVVIGTLASHFIDPPDNQGNWPHYHLKVSTPQGEYDCVINLKSVTQVKVEYRDFRNVDRARFSQILALSDGFHALASSSASGALDHVRHPGLQNPLVPCLWPLPGWPKPEWPLPEWPRPLLRWRRRCNCTQWWKENGLNLIKLMQYYVENVERIYVFGEPYTSGLGVHNVHMNQGDPIGSSFSAENGIWQDGGVIYEYTTPQPRLSVMLTKFETQSLQTDSNGRPLQVPCCR